MALTYGGLVRVMLGLPLVRFFRGIFDAQAVAYSTSSSSATLPVTISCAQDNLGMRPAVASSVLPLGATVNMDGTSLYLGILSLFAAQAFGLSLETADYVLIAITATLASVGAAGIPSASLFLLATVLSVFEVSPEQAALMRGAVEAGGLEHIDGVMRAIESTGALQYTAQLARREAESALEALEAVPDSEYRQALSALAKLSVDRSY